MGCALYIRCALSIHQKERRKSLGCALYIGARYVPENTVIWNKLLRKSLHLVGLSHAYDDARLGECNVFYPLHEVHMKTGSVRPTSTQLNRTDRLKVAHVHVHRNSFTVLKNTNLKFLLILMEENIKKKKRKVSDSLQSVTTKSKSRLTLKAEL
jgi:hypothetical protein